MHNINHVQLIWLKPYYIKHDTKQYVVHNTYNTPTDDEVSKEENDSNMVHVADDDNMIVIMDKLIVQHIVLTIKSFYCTLAEHIVQQTM